MFFDAAGNRMIVAAPEAAPESNPAATEAAKGAPTTEPTDSLAHLPAMTFQGEGFVDVDDFEREMARREGERFYVIPDGMGGRRNVPARSFNSGPEVAETTAVSQPRTQWQVCRVIVPLLKVAPARRHDLRFPAIDRDDVVYAGYLLEAPTGAARAWVWSYEQAGTRAFPVLARVDAQDRIVAIVNNMPTQSIPESTFRYGSVGGSVELNPVVGKTRYAVLDGVRLQGKLPPACGMQAAADVAATGLVTVQFSGAGEQ